ncbi:hypothetical protein LNQ03_04320 [Klebsiella pneumoniae subsp. pneumoniae]|nr:hypothetical protein [Klebsiella pneumoniae subsp. pneumoniae]
MIGPRGEIQKMIPQVYPRGVDHHRDPHQRLNPLRPHRQLAAMGADGAVWFRRALLMSLRQLSPIVSPPATPVAGFSSRHLPLWHSHCFI